VTDLALSAMTNAILVALICFLAGLSFRTDQDKGSAAGLFAVYLTLAGLANLLGTIHHGFVEGSGHAADIPLRTATRVVIALGVFTFLMSMARQFMPAWGQRLSFGLGLLGLAGTVFIVATEDNFLVLVAGNLLVMLLTLGLHVRGLRDGTGSVAMIVGIVLTIAASMLIPIGGDGIAGLGLYGTFHIALIPGILFQYLGGCALSRRLPSS
jgi:hypothetical protein